VAISIVASPSGLLAIQLTDQEIKDIIEYLKTLK